jgi:hypothetical protein
LPRIRCGAEHRLFGFLLLSHLFYLTALILNFLLLLLELALGLLVRYFLILHFVANHIAATGAEGSTNRRARTRMADCGADYCASAGTQQRAYTGSFFAFGERLPGASADQQDCRQSERRGG